MRILMLHNYYRSCNPSGEAVSFEAEAALLEHYGHFVVRYTRRSDELSGLGVAGQVTAAVNAVWSVRSFLEVRRQIRSLRPDVVHCQNLFPLLSPSVYAACRAEGVPVVQSLRNFRFVCLDASLYRDGKKCHICLGQSLPWQGLLHGCYRGSRAASAAVFAMLAVQRALSLQCRLVNAFIVNSEFAREILLTAGLPAGKVFVKPNFVFPDPGPGAGGSAALFVGRLSKEKGILTVLRAWEELPDIPLRVIGDGPERAAVEGAARRGLAVEWLGSLAPGAVYQEMKRSHCVVFPSELYETFGRVAAEAFACGAPVVAAGHGAAAEIVEDGRTGLLFQPGNARDLAAKVRLLFEDTNLAGRMRAAARNEYLRKYTAERNYQLLMEIYRFAVRSAGRVVESRECPVKTPVSSRVSSSA